MLLKEGDVVSLQRNQGWREAEVLAVIGNEALVEYEMPKGTTVLNIIRADADEPNDEPYKTVAYCSLPVKWLQRLVENQTQWIGHPSTHYRAVKRWRRAIYDLKEIKRLPAPSELLAERRRKDGNL